MANKFSKASLRRLEGVDERLRELAFRVLEVHDCTVVYGLRTAEEQRQLVNAGLSRTMASKHLIGRAIDLAPYVQLDDGFRGIPWSYPRRYFDFFAGIVHAVAHDMGLPIRWGGNWDGDDDLTDQKFMDLVHFELL